MKQFYLLLTLLGCCTLLTGCGKGDDVDADAAGLVLAEQNFEANPAGDLIITTLTADGEVTFTPSARWCRVAWNRRSEVDNLEITVDANREGSEREATVEVASAGCETRTITIHQRSVEVVRCELLSFRLEAAKNDVTEDVVFKSASGRTFKGLYLTWIEGEHPEMMIPTFTTNGVRVLCNGVEVESGKTPLSFAEDFVLTVESSAGPTQDYTISLNCPQINTELPVLRMCPAQEITSKDYYVKTDIQLYSPDTSEGWWNSAEQGQVEMRGRGNSTWGLPKKPYRLKFPQKYSPIGLNHASAKSWVLLANDMDKSLLRDDLGFVMSRLLFDKSEGYHDADAVLFTSCSQHINLYMNNKYHGVYQLCDQMERAKGRIEVDKLEAADGSDEKKITGGYIVETDIHEGSFYSSRNVRMSHKYPDDDDYDPAQYTYIRNYIRTAEAALYGSNFKDPTEGWRHYFDEKTLADYIIIKELCGDMDGYTSTYFYKRRGNDKFYFGPIWDVDKGWDNENRLPHSNPKTNLMIYAGFYMPGASYPDWFHRFWEDETFRAFVAKRWASKRQALLDAVHARLDEQTAKMRKAVEANFVVWPFNYQACADAKMPAATYALEIERLRTLTNERANLLDGLFR